MDNTEEKYISNIPMKDKPKKPLGLFLRDKSVTTKKLADEAVTTPKIADEAITREKVADNAIGTEQIDDAAITSEKIQNGAIGSLELAEKSVKAEHIEDDAVITNKIKNNNVTWDKLTSETQDLIKAGTGADGNLIHDMEEWNTRISTLEDTDKTKQNHLIEIDGINNGQNKDIASNTERIASLESEDKSNKGRLDNIEQTNQSQEEHLTNLDTKDANLQESINNITKTGEASAAENVTFNHNNVNFDASNVQQGIEEVYKKSNYNDGDSVIDFNTIHLIVDNPEYVCALVDINNKLLVGYNRDSGSPYWGYGVPKQVKDYIDEKVNAILGTEDITSTIDSLKEVEKFLQDFSNSDTLSALLSKKADKTYVDNSDNAIKQSITSEAARAKGVEDNLNTSKADLTKVEDYYSKSNPRDTEGSVIPTNTILSVVQNEEYVLAIVDNEDHLLFGLKRKDGEGYFAKLPNEIEELIHNIADGYYAKSNPNDSDGNVVDTNSFFKVINNEEYRFLITDSEEHILIGLKNSGDWSFGGSIPQEVKDYVRENGITTEDLSEKVNKYIPYKWNSLYGKTFGVLGDSLSVLGTWATRLAEITHSSFVNYSRGGTRSMSIGLGMDGGTMERAQYLLKEHPDVDAILVENINDVNGTRANVGEKTDAPFMHLYTIQSVNTYDYYNAAVAALATEVKAATPQIGTILEILYKTGAKKLTITTLPTKNGSVIINIGTHKYNIDVLTTDTMQSIQSKIVNWDFSEEHISDDADGTDSVVFKNTSKSAAMPAISVDSGDTGLEVSITDVSTTGSANYCFVSRDKSEWNDTSKWVGFFQVSMWSQYKGLYGWLIEHFPTAQIYLCIFPRIMWGDDYKYADGTYDYSAYDKADVNARSLMDFQDEFARYFMIPCINVAQNCNMGLINGSNYISKNDVHPGKAGQDRWGETIARLI